MTAPYISGKATEFVWLLRLLRFWYRSVLSL